MEKDTSLQICSMPLKFMSTSSTPLSILPPRVSSTWRLRETTQWYRESGSSNRFCTWGVEKCRFSMRSMAVVNHPSRLGVTLFFSSVSGVAEISPPFSSNTASDTSTSLSLAYSSSSASCSSCAVPSCSRSAFLMTR